MRQYVYQFSVRKPDEELKKFRIETETIYSNKEFTQSMLDEMSKKYECDVMMLPIGILLTTKKEKELMKSEFYSEKDIQKFIDKWNKKVEA